MEQAFTVIAFKIMQYSYSLKCFFKQEFKRNDGVYVIPFSHILYFKRNIFPLIRDACEKKCYFRDFCFYNFRYKKDEVHQMEKIAGWDFNVLCAKDLSHLSYSQRLHYLN